MFLKGRMGLTPLIFGSHEVYYPMMAGFFVPKNGKMIPVALSGLLVVFCQLCDPYKKSCNRSFCKIICCITVKKQQNLRQ